MDIQKVESGKTIEIDRIDGNLELGDGVTIVPKGKVAVINGTIIIVGFILVISPIQT